MRLWKKLRNIQRDPRVVLSFVAPHDRGAVLNPYAVLNATATVEPSDHAWDLLNRLTKVYMQPDSEFALPRGPGYIARYRVEQIGGVGPGALGRFPERSPIYLAQSEPNKWSVRSSTTVDSHF